VALEDGVLRDVASSLHAVTVARAMPRSSRSSPASGSIATSSCAGASTALRCSARWYAPMTRPAAAGRSR